MSYKGFEFEVMPLWSYGVNGVTIYYPKTWGAEKVDAWLEYMQESWDRGVAKVVKP